MKRTLFLIALIMLASMLVFTACKESPTDPDNNNNNNYPPDTDPPDYSTFIRGYFRADVMVTKQYATYSVDEFMSFTPAYNLFGSFSGGTFHAETTIYSGGEHTEELTISIDTLTGVITDLDYHLTFVGPSSAYERSISLTDLPRTEKYVQALVFLADSGSVACSHIASLDYDYDVFTTPSNNFTITNHHCETWSFVSAGLGTY